MNRRLILATCVSLLLLTHTTAHAQFATAVLSFDPGTDPAAGYSDPATALGSPERFTGEGSFPGNVTVFNPPFGEDELVSVGGGGHLTLRLSHYVVPDAAGPEIGVFTNAGIADENFPAGQAGNPLFAFGVDNALVEVSEDGLSWTSLGDTTFDIPTQGYIDPAATAESDFTRPFTGVLSDFNGLPLSEPATPDILELLEGSGGGKWLDISGTPLANVGYIRFSVPEGSGGSFELDAVSISATARGARVPEPGALALLNLLLIGLLRRNYGIT
jgi:hypothetical protein